MQVRAATLADAQAIAEVHVASWQTSYRGILPEAFLAGLSVENRARQWRKGLENPQRTFPILVATSGGRVVGFADYGPSRDADAKPGTMELYAIYLFQDFQRRGLGHELWVGMSAAMRKADATAVTVWVLAANRPGRRFYEQLGFATDGAVKQIECGAVSLSEVRYRFRID